MQTQNRVGQQFGNYQLTQLIGSGGYAEVYLAKHMHLPNLQHAIKILTGANLQEEQRESFLTEARTIANLQNLSTHIVQLQDVGIQTSGGVSGDGIPYIVMEYAAGGTLRKLYPSGTQVPLEQIAFYTRQVAEALQCAHDQHPPIIHRDIKPENMLLRSRDHLLLSDFGIAVSGTTTSRVDVVSVRDKDIIGTVTYMAPERFAKRTRRASDQYSLAVVVYEWLSGSPPFDGADMEIVYKQRVASPPELHTQYPHVTKEIEDVVMRALEKDPDDRFPSVRAFSDALGQAIQQALQSVANAKSSYSNKPTNVLSSPPPQPSQSFIGSQTSTPSSPFAQPTAQQQPFMQQASPTKVLPPSSTNNLPSSTPSSPFILPAAQQHPPMQPSSSTKILPSSSMNVLPSSTPSSSFVLPAVQPQPFVQQPLPNNVLPSSTISTPFAQPAAQSQPQPSLPTPIAPLTPPALQPSSSATFPGSQNQPSSLSQPFDYDALTETFPPKAGSAQSATPLQGIPAPMPLHGIPLSSAQYQGVPFSPPSFQKASFSPPPFSAAPQPRGRGVQDFFAFSAQFLWNSENSFFLFGGIALNVLTAITLGLLQHNYFMLLGGTVFSVLMLILCACAVGRVIATFFGILVALYWLVVGWTVGNILTSSLHIDQSQLPMIIGIGFFIVSLILHIRYISGKNA